VEGRWSPGGTAATAGPCRPRRFRRRSAQVASLTPTLRWTNATDADHDTLSYEVSVADEGGTVVASAVGVVEGVDESEWTVTPPLAENGVFVWRVRAADADAAGPWSAERSFRVNAGRATHGTRPLQPAGMPSRAAARTACAVLYRARRHLAPNGSRRPHALADRFMSAVRAQPRALRQRWRSTLLEVEEDVWECRHVPSISGLLIDDVGVPDDDGSG